MKDKIIRRETIEDIMKYYKEVYDRKMLENRKEGEETPVEWLIRMAALNSAVAHTEANVASWWIDRYYTLEKVYNKAMKNEVPVKISWFKRMTSFLRKK